jgi:hypothetical protein
MRQKISWASLVWLASYECTLLSLLFSLLVLPLSFISLHLQSLACILNQQGRKPCTMHSWVDQCLSWYWGLMQLYMWSQACRKAAFSPPQELAHLSDRCALQRNCCTVHPPLHWQVIPGWTWFALPVLSLFALARYSSQSKSLYFAKY